MDEQQANDLAALRELAYEALRMLDELRSLNEKHPSHGFGEARIRGRLVGIATTLRDGLNMLATAAEAQQNGARDE